MIRWRSGKDVVFEDRAVGDRDRVVLLRHRSLADRLERDHRVVVADRRLWSPSAPGAAILRDLILMVSTRSSSQNATDGILKIPEFRRFQRACKGTKCRIFSRSYNAICCTLLFVRQLFETARERLPDRLLSRHAARSRSLDPRDAFGASGDRKLDAAQYLVERLGGDRLLTHSEHKKLTLYAGEGGHVEVRGHAGRYARSAPRPAPRWHAARRSQPAQELARLKRLGDVVVGAAFKAETRSTVSAAATLFTQPARQHEPGTGLRRKVRSTPPIPRRSDGARGRLRVRPAEGLRSPSLDLS